MKRVAVVLGVLVMGLVGPAEALSTYSGSLSAADPDHLLIAEGGAWDNLAAPPASLSWQVTEIASGRWRYQYTLTVSGAGIDRVIIESRGTTADLVSASGSLILSPASNPTGWIDNVAIGSYSTLPDNPGLPGTLSGIQFSCIDSAGSLPTLLTISFESAYKPVWGDFYARGWGFTCSVTNTFEDLGNYAYNGGFNVADPTAPPSDGSILSHVLVPLIPAPGAVLLGSLGVVCVGWLRRRGSV